MMCVCAVLSSFLEEHHEGCGAVLKAPFTTNSSHVKFIHSLVQLDARLRSWFRTLGGSIPYLILQPCLRNRREYKIVCLGEVPLYVARIKGHDSRHTPPGINQAFTSDSVGHSDLKAFAAAAISKIHAAQPGLLLADGLFRVDIMVLKNGKMVVNELESMEANYDSTRIINEGHVSQYLRTYYAAKIVKCVTEFAAEL